MSLTLVRSCTATASLVALVSLLGMRHASADGIHRVAWLTGCWESSNTRRTIDEHWMAPRGGVMLGSGRTVRNDSLTEYEVIVLRQQGTQLAYHAHPSGQTPTVFLSTTITDSSVVFENLKHDFPQQVGYNRRGADSLVAWISGPRGGTTRRIEFAHKRVSCVPTP
jgi:hypothetical protein